MSTVADIARRVKADRPKTVTQHIEEARAILTDNTLAPAVALQRANKCLDRALDSLEIARINALAGLDDL